MINYFQIMPQIDYTTFLSQSFIIISIFFSLYIGITFLLLPILSFNQKIKEKIYKIIKNIIFLYFIYSLLILVSMYKSTIFINLILFIKNLFYILYFIYTLLILVSIYKSTIFINLILFIS